MRPVSIIVPCRNEAGAIRGFALSLERQQLDGLDWEAIIADGMSDDGTRAILDQVAARNPRIRVIDNPKRTVSPGLNEAIRQSRGEIILRMDVHSTYAPDYVARCVEALDASGAANVGGAARPVAKGLIPEAIAAAYQSAFGCGGARFHQSDFEGYVDTVTYGCWPRAVFEEVGLFDEQLPRNQDDELNLRIVRSGRKIWQSSKIVSWYQPRRTLRQLARQYFQYGFWKVAVIRKHRLPGAWRHLVPAAFFGALAV
ncbi:MAG: glycosyltransferase family 2 protein [Bryobacterales bacterium]